METGALFEDFTRADAIRALRETLHALQEMGRLMRERPDEIGYQRWQEQEVQLWPFLVREISQRAINEGLGDEALIHLLQKIEVEANTVSGLKWEPEVEFWHSKVVDEIAQHCTDALEYNLCRPTEQAARRVPDELTTTEARKWMEYAVSKGLLNKDWMPTDKVSTKQQKALLAGILCERIGITIKQESKEGTRICTFYKPFETLWGVKHLAQERYKSLMTAGDVRGGEIITQAFKE